MSELLYMQEADSKSNEPTVHSLVRRSFVFVPSAGMRLAPEMLVLELMREVFFKHHYGADKAQDLNSDNLHTDEQRAVLHAMRGRRKNGKKDQPEYFFAPAYPSLASFGWPRKNDARVIYNFLFSGPLAQYLWNRGEHAEKGKIEQEEMACVISDALIGKKSLLAGESLSGKDILATALGLGGFNENDRVPSRERIKDKTRDLDHVMRVSEDDELATRILRDFLSICKIEGEIPRMQWLHLLMTFLRFALPMWLLAQMRITSLLHSWLLRAVDKEELVDAREINEKLSERNRGLLRPTLTVTRELTDHVELYMKHRVEVDILLCCLERVRPSEVKGKVLVREGARSEEMPIESLLVLARDAKKDISSLPRFQEISNGKDINIQTFLTREGERFPAWRHPLKKGQGKNIKEFLRVLYGAADRTEEEGGYLVMPEGRGVRGGFRVFPGQLLLKTVTYLAAENKGRGEAGKPMLQDVEELFAQYGIDFSAAADARPLLVEDLQAMGLLRGSPDAGSSVVVARPY